MLVLQPSAVFGWMPSAILGPKKNDSKYKITFFALFVGGR
jgi:hypothetical protein